MGLPGAATAKINWGIVSIVFVLFLPSAIIVSNIKYYSLSYDRADYSFYMQFYSKALDPSLSNRYSLNPRGRNLFFQKGYDGERGFFKTVHFEPVKYLMALIWRLAPTPIAVFAAFSALYLGGMWAIFLLARRRLPIGVASLLAVTFGIAYITPEAISYDARPISLLGVALLTSFLTIHFRAPSKLVVATFLLMFAVREEAVVFGFVLLAYTWVMSLSRDDPYYLNLRRVLTPAYVLATVLVLSYLLWSGYPVSLQNTPLAKATTAVPLAVALAIIALLLLVAIRRRWYRLRYAPLFTLSLLALPLAYQFGQDLWSGQEGIDIPGLLKALTSGRGAVAFAAGFIWLVALWDTVPSSAVRATCVGVTAALLVASLAYHGIITRRQVQDYLEAREIAGPLWELRSRLGSDGRTRVTLLTDYTTYQAFFDWETVYVMERLPRYLFREGRAPSLVKLLREEVDYIAVSVKKRPVLMGLLKEARLSGDVEIVADNGHYMILRVFRPGSSSAHRTMLPPSQS